MNNFVPVLIKQIISNKHKIMGQILTVHGQSNKFQATIYNAYLVKRYSEFARNMAVLASELKINDIVFVHKEDLYGSPKISKGRKNLAGARNRVRDIK